MLLLPRGAWLLCCLLVVVCEGADGAKRNKTSTTRGRGRTRGGGLVSMVNQEKESEFVSKGKSKFSGDLFLYQEVGKAVKVRKCKTLMNVCLEVCLMLIERKESFNKNSNSWFSGYYSLKYSSVMYFL